MRAQAYGIVVIGSPGYRRVVQILAEDGVTRGRANDEQSMGILLAGRTNALVASSVPSSSLSGWGSPKQIMTRLDRLHAAWRRAILLQLYARATRVHSVVIFASPRRWKRLNPMILLMIPNTGSTVCFRNL